MVFLFLLTAFSFSAKTRFVVRLTFAPLLLMLAGCATTPDRPRSISFESDPPGAAIYYGAGANDKFAEPKSYLGTTPFAWSPELNGDGSFKLPGALVYSIFIPPVIVFEARLTGQTSRQKFHGGTIATGADKAPAKIMFKFAVDTNEAFRVTSRP